MEKGLLALERAQATGEVQREEEPESALAYLQDIYKGRRAADHVRMKAARECLPFETPEALGDGHHARREQLCDCVGEGHFQSAVERGASLSNSRLTIRRPMAQVKARPGKVNDGLAILALLVLAAVVIALVNGWGGGW